MATPLPHAPVTNTGSGRALVRALVALLALTLISWAVSNLALGSASTAVALAIAAIKAFVVAYAFMELPRAAAPARITAIVTVSFIALLCAGAVADIGLR